MAKIKTLFDTLYAATDEAVTTIQKPGREKMIKRVAERLADEVQDKKVEAEVKMTTLEHKLANTKDEDAALEVYKEIVNLRREVEEAEAIANEVLAVKERLFCPAPEEAV